MPVNSDHDHDESCREVMQCTLAKIAEIACDAANEAHRNGTLLAEINTSLASLAEMYRGAHPEQAVQLDRLARIEATVRACCPPKDAPGHDVYHYEPCEPGGRRGSGDTNSNNEVGISCAWGGGGNYGSHVVGIIGDFVLWYGEASNRISATSIPTRFGDYLHVRLAYPDTRFFSGFGYAVHSTASGGESANYLYVEFGREAIPSPGLR